MLLVSLVLFFIIVDIPPALSLNGSRSFLTFHVSRTSNESRYNTTGIQPGHNGCVRMHGHDIRARGTGGRDS